MPNLEQVRASSHLQTHAKWLIFIKKKKHKLNNYLLILFNYSFKKEIPISFSLDKHKPICQNKN